MDRRRACRYPAVIKDALLAWDAGGSRVEVPVELINISIGSCLVRSRRGPAPRPGGPVSLQVPGIEPANWIEGVVVSTDKRFLRRHTTRIQFLALLPFGTFKILVTGPQGSAHELTDRPEYEMDMFWR
jgi:hypothetical protein